MKYTEGVPQPATPQGTKSSGSTTPPRRGRQARAVEGVRTRFAPSPTGFLHVGGIRTALFAWLVAQQANGQFILRIEDTDKEREVKGSEQHIMDSLRWLGLDWDEGPDKAGEYGPYRQSKRLDSYKEWAQKLIEKGRAYADPYSPEELEKLRQKAKEEKKPFLFRDHRPGDPPKWDGSQPLRFKSNPKTYHWRDEVMGDLSVGKEAIDDFIIIKSDGYPTYNFAHIIDDQLMNISHVIRSQEFTASVPKYLNLYEALEFERPKLATVPYVLGPDGKKKLSKRDGAKDILDYQKEGFLPEALVNFLATLGWNDGTEQEIFSTKDLIKKFDLSRVQKSGARFDKERLLWMNGHYIRQKKVDELAELIEGEGRKEKGESGFWPPEAAEASKKYKKQVLGLIQERLKYLAELPELTLFFFAEPDIGRMLKLFKEPVDKQLQKIDYREYKPILGSAYDELLSNNFKYESLKNSLNQLLEKLQSKPGILFALVRIATTGSTSSPEIFSTLETLGKKESLSRLKRAISYLGK